ncbi:response regulator [Candidatus Nomurabacteria bacterium]|nr:response regulator [Candidatus Kaiserbacteria bacterium]MCB9814707.1 response regulator [Candidatus Nomurabacteria bacterium]
MSKKTVLIIEDSPYLAESLVDMLTIKEYGAIVAANGRDGVVAALEQQPDLILLDIRLPDIDGYEVYRRIREDKWGAKAKIVVLTASESIENISKNIDLPKDYVLFKPDWSIKDLLSKIEALVND